MHFDASSLPHRARACLLVDEVDTKLAFTRDTWMEWSQGHLNLTRSDWPSESIEIPGRPMKPELVDPKQLTRRTLATEAGRMAMIHAIAHIEFNAINLAWDAVQRFTGMPDEYYQDWARVAREEAEHFTLLRERLRAGGADYGNYPAHDGLWDMARRTAHDPLHRMALVPRMLEARGLDVTPGLISRFKSAGDTDTVKILELILREEIGHVARGSRWFRYLCEQRSLEPEQTYIELLTGYLPGGMRCPLQHEPRRQAGFSDDELKQLEDLCRSRSA